MLFDTLLSVFPYAFIAYLIVVNRKSLIRLIKAMKYKHMFGLILSYVLLILLATFLLYFIARPFVNSLAIQSNILKTGLIFTLILIVFVPLQYAIHKATKYFTKKSPK